jgi:hypothetical protein
MKKYMTLLGPALLLGCAAIENSSRQGSSTSGESKIHGCDSSKFLDLRALLGRWAMAVVNDVDIVYYTDPSRLDALLIDYIEDESSRDGLPLTPDVGDMIKKSRQCLIGRIETQRVEGKPIISQRFILMSDDCGRITRLTYSRDGDGPSSWKLSANLRIIPIESHEDRIQSQMSIANRSASTQIFFQKRLK